MFDYHDTLIKAVKRSRALEQTKEQERQNAMEAVEREYGLVPPSEDFDGYDCTIPNPIHQSRSPMVDIIVERILGHDNEKIAAKLHMNPANKTPTTKKKSLNYSLFRSPKTPLPIYADLAGNKLDNRNVLKEVLNSFGEQLKNFTSPVVTPNNKKRERINDYNDDDEKIESLKKK